MEESLTPSQPGAWLVTVVWDQSLRSACQQNPHLLRTHRNRPFPSPRSTLEEGHQLVPPTARTMNTSEARCQDSALKVLPQFSCNEPGQPVAAAIQEGLQVLDEDPVQNAPFGRATPARRE